jgi:hypothetical protein
MAMAALSVDRVDPVGTALVIAVPSGVVRSLPLVAAPCRCEHPLPCVRPSGQVICLNASCGGTIKRSTPKKERP